MGPLEIGKAIPPSAHQRLLVEHASTPPLQRHMNRHLIMANDLQKDRVFNELDDSMKSRLI